MLADFLACVAQSCHLHFARTISQIHALLPKLHDESNARLYQETGRHAASTLPSAPPHFSAGSVLTWDGKTWEVVNQGKSQTWLKDDAGSVISLSEQTLSNLLAQGSAQVVAVPAVTSAPGGETAQELLAWASAADLAEANRRHALLSAYRAGGWNPVYPDLEMCRKMTDWAELGYQCRHRMSGIR